MKVLAKRVLLKTIGQFQSGTRIKVLQRGVNSSKIKIESSIFFVSNDLISAKNGVGYNA
jgi:hypothetical protein